MIARTVLVIGLAALCACSPKPKEVPMTTLITTRPFGFINGQPVVLYTLTNSKGISADITNYGARVAALRVPGRSGIFADIVLGFDTLDGYLKENPYFGAIVGRYGNRIAKGQFKLDGKPYTLARNNGQNSLHGGTKGFDKQVWAARDISTPDSPALELSYLSKDGEEGYPGNLSAKVTYTLSNDNELKIEYAASTDKDTVVNLTNHSYFNLAGQGNGDILGHELMIEADKFTPVNAGLIPTGQLRNVAGTPFDFRQSTPVGKRMNDNDAQLKLGGGYDHNFVLSHPAGQIGLAARVTEPVSGRVLEVRTVEPGVQFYTGNFLDGTITGKGGKVYNKHAALCLETQHFPDSPNQPGFPSTVVKPGAPYASVTIWKFSVNK